MIFEYYPTKYDSLEKLRAEVPYEKFKMWMDDGLELSAFANIANKTQECDFNKILSQVGGALLKSEGAERMKEKVDSF